MSNEKQIISIVTVGGTDVIALVQDTTWDGAITVKAPAMYIPGANQFVPYASTLDCDRTVTFQPEHYVAAGEPLGFFQDAFRETFPELFIDESAMLAEAKARADRAEIASPYHGKKESESGIILTA